MSDTYILTLVEVQLPRIIQGTQGRIHLTISDLNGEDVDLTKFDAITLVLKNYPEEDETINRTCYVSEDDDTICYFDFTDDESSGWLASPYYAELKFKRYVRDSEVVTSSTGYVPQKSFMNFENCTADFTEGETITGALSGATAVVYAFEGYGGIGELELVSITGTFQDGEEITSPGGGTAYVVVGITNSEYLDDTFADDSEDFVSLGVAIGDELVIELTTYVVTGYDEIMTGWLTLEEENESPGSGITYTINTYDPATSATDYLYKTLPFALYIDESLS